jgi:hypothetical protein
VAQRCRIKQVALSRPQDHNLPFSTWSLAKLADFWVADWAAANNLELAWVPTNAPG